MATKDVLLKKRLIKEGAILGVVLIVLGAGGYMLSDYDDDTQSEKTSKEGENSAMRGEHESIKQELGNGLEMSTFYQKYTDNHNPSFLLDREAASKQMATLREKNHIANLAVTISPITDFAMDTVHLKSGVLTRSDVRLTFGAVTDNSIYRFIEDLERTLPGVMAVKELKFSRTGELSSSVVVGLSEHRLSPLVAGELTFVWLGIRPPDAPKGPGQTPAGTR